MNELVTLTSKEIKAAVARIVKVQGRIETGYLSIINDIGHLRDSAAWKDLFFEDKGYRNMRDFVAGELGMSKSTMYNLLSIYDNYAIDGVVPQDVLSQGMRPLLKQIEEKKEEEKEEDNVSRETSEEKEEDNVSRETSEELPFETETDRETLAAELTFTASDVTDLLKYLKSDDYKSDIASGWVLIRILRD